MSLRAFGKRLSDAFNALVAPFVIARLEMERDAAKRDYMVIRGRDSLHLCKIDEAAAQGIVDQANKALEQWKPR